MRLASLFLILLLAVVAPPARAQTIDPALVGTWAQVRLRIWPVSKQSWVVTTTLTIAPDGRSTSHGVRRSLHGEPLSFDAEVRLTTEGGRLVEVLEEGRTPTVEEVARYRVEGDRLFIRSETWTEGEGVHGSLPRRLVSRVAAEYRRVDSTTD